MPFIMLPLIFLCKPLSIRCIRFSETLFRIISPWNLYVYKRCTYNRVYVIIGICLYVAGRSQKKTVKSDNYLSHPTAFSPFSYFFQLTAQQLQISSYARELVITLSFVIQLLKTVSAASCSSSPEVEPQRSSITAQSARSL